NMSIPTHDALFNSLLRTMPNEFPIHIPNRLPVKIDPCPIVEAILEVRFITSESWRTLPGCLFTHIPTRYPHQKELPLAQMPQEMLRQQTSLPYQPLVQFLGDHFSIQFGPLVVSLATKANHYPGWQAVEDELKWLLHQLQQIRFVAEGERLGVRYINF